MKIKNLFDIFVTIIMLIIAIGFLKSKIVILHIDIMELLEFVASIWTIIRFGGVTLDKVKNIMLEKEIKRKKKYYR